MLRKIGRTHALVLVLVMLLPIVAANASAKKNVKVDSSETETVVETTETASTEVQVLEPPEDIEYPWALIDAVKGGEIIVAEGVVFRVKPKTLQEDTVIWAGMEATADGLNFIFGPSGTRFVKNLKDKSALLSVTRQVLENGEPGCIVKAMTDLIEADLASLYQDMKRYKKALSKEPELSESLSVVTEYLEKLIVELQKAETLSDFVVEFQKTAYFVLYLNCLIMDSQDAGGLDAIVEDLEAIVQTLSGDPIGNLKIYSEYYGEYIAAYSITGDTVVWKIPHFSLYYFRRR